MKSVFYATLSFPHLLCESLRKNSWIKTFWNGLFLNFLRAIIFINTFQCFTFTLLFCNCLNWIRFLKSYLEKNFSKAFLLCFSEESWVLQYYSHFVNSFNEPAHKRLNVCRPFFFCFEDQRQITIFILHSLDEDNDKHLSLQCLTKNPIAIL